MDNKLSAFKRWLSKGRKSQVDRLLQDPQLSHQAEEELSELPDDIVQNILE